MTLRDRLYNNDDEWGEPSSLGAVALYGGEPVWFPEEYVMPERLAQIYADAGNLILGPGPRNWTLLADAHQGDSPGAQYRILGHRGGGWYLRKVREWR